MAQMAVDSGAESARSADFFISRAGADAYLAAQIGHILEGAGYRVILQQWDFGHKNFMGAITRAPELSAACISPMKFLWPKSHC